MTYARDFDALIAPICEDRSLSREGVMAEGLRASWLGLPGVPREAETIVLERDLRLVALTGARYHAALISNRLSLEAMARARQAGLPATCGVSINHLTLNELDVGDYRTFLKLKPPLRAEDERLAPGRGAEPPASSTSSAPTTIRRTSTPSGCRSRKPKRARSGSKRCCRRACVSLRADMSRCRASSAR